MEKVKYKSVGIYGTYMPYVSKKLYFLIHYIASSLWTCGGRYPESRKVKIHQEENHLNNNNTT